MASTITKREAALRELVKLIGTQEVGYANRGPKVDEITGADTLPGVGYAWCQSAQNYAWRKANGEYLAGGTASVGLAVQWARDRGYVVSRPFRGDLVAFQFTSDSWPDHVGMVEKVLSLGPVLILQTIEGNTSPDDGGSQDDGGGLYRRRRVVRADRVIFYRVPGLCPNPSRYLRPVSPENPHNVWTWIRWKRGHGEFKLYGPANARVRPNVPARVPLAWWGRLTRNITGGKAT